MIRNKTLNGLIVRLAISFGLAIAINKVVPSAVWELALVLFGILGSILVIRNTKRYLLCRELSQRYHRHTYDYIANAVFDYNLDRHAWIWNWEEEVFTFTVVEEMQRQRQRREKCGTKGRQFLRIILVVVGGVLLLAGGAHDKVINAMILAEQLGHQTTLAQTALLASGIIIAGLVSLLAGLSIKD